MSEDEAFARAVAHDCVPQFNFFRIFLGMPAKDILVKLGI